MQGKTLNKNLLPRLYLLKGIKFVIFYYLNLPIKDHELHTSTTLKNQNSENKILTHNSLLLLLFHVCGFIFITLIADYILLRKSIYHIIHRFTVRRE